MNILFMGTPDFAVPCLDILVKDGYDICGVITQPDKPRGRGHKLTPPPVKVCANENNIPVFQPETLKNNGISDVLESLKPEIIIVVAYGKILPEYVLNYPKYGCVNVHASDLPKYRGAAPVQRCVINGEKETGVTTMYMEKGLDTGDMIYKSKTPIPENETYGILHDRLSLMGAELLLKTVKAIEKGIAPREKQNDAEASYAQMITKETGKIDWSSSAESILNLIRGLNPYPMSQTSYGDEVMKIISAEKSGSGTGEAGSLRIGNKSIEVLCGDMNYIKIKELQFKGSKPMTAESYLNGHSMDESIILK